MSAANIYQPSVFIDGTRLGESAPVAGLAAVARFSITWGSKDWWSNVEPAELELTLLDPHGELLGVASEQTIEVKRAPNDTVVFRGAIDEVKSAYGKTTDPRTGDKRDMWTHRIKAFDPFGTMKRDRRRGPTYDARDIAPYRLHWGPCYMSERKSDLSSRSPVAIVWEPTPLDQYDGATPILIMPVPAYERQQVVSLLTVLRNTARVSNPLNRPYYFPSENRIRFVSADQPEDSGLVNNRDSAGKIRLFPLDSISAQATLLPGSKLSVDGGIATGNSLREQVTRLELTMRSTRPTSFVATDTDRYMENVESSHAVQAVSQPAQEMTVQADIDHASAFWYDEEAAVAHQKAVNGIRPIYGAPTFEPYRYQFDKHRPAPAWALPWLTPEPTLNRWGNLVVYHLVESLTNWVPGSLPFSIVGGTLSYTHARGWEVAHNTAPRSVDDDQRTLGDVFEDQTLANVGDNSIIADWQRISVTS